MSLAVANQYAKALLEVVLDSRSGLAAEEALAQLDAFDSALRESQELRTVMHSPAVDAQQKRNVVRRLGDSAGMHPLIRNFLAVVIGKRRLALLPEIRERFRALQDDRMGIARAHVSSARPLLDAVRASLEPELERLTGKSVQCDYRVDPELVAGIKVGIGSTVYDGSVHGQLDALRRRMTREE